MQVSIAHLQLAFSWHQHQPATIDATAWLTFPLQLSAFVVPLAVEETAISLLELDLVGSTIQLASAEVQVSPTWAAPLVAI